MPIGAKYNGTMLYSVILSFLKKFTGIWGVCKVESRITQYAIQHPNTTARGWGSNSLWGWFFFKILIPWYHLGVCWMPNNISKLYLLSRINTLMRTSVIMMITGISMKRMLHITRWNINWLVSKPWNFCPSLIVN